MATVRPHSQPHERWSQHPRQLDQGGVARFFPPAGFDGVQHGHRDPRRLGELLPGQPARQADRSEPFGERVRQSYGREIVGADAIPGGVERKSFGCCRRFR